MIAEAVPESLRLALQEFRREQEERYGEAFFEVTKVTSGLRATVLLPAQAEAVRELAERHWPGAGLSLLVLAQRPARLALGADGVPLSVWRQLKAGGELATQLLPGDPPAELLGVSRSRWLVRAPGEAIGWVERGDRYRLGAAPEPGPEETARWDPQVVGEAALSMLGLPYLRGGTGAQGVDCSGLVWRAFFKAGVLLPRNSRQQRRCGERVGAEELHLADLLGVVHRGPRRSSHIALALSPTEVVHASTGRGEVVREPLAEFLQRYQLVAARRLLGAASRER